MNLMIPFLVAVFAMAVLPAASAAQSQSGGGSDVPSVAIPKTTEVLVLLTLKQGVTPQQIGYTGRNSGNCKALPGRENPPVVFALMDHQYIPVGLLMSLRALNPGALE